MDDKISPVALLEKTITLDGKVTAAHNRLDKMEFLLRDDLTEIKKELKEVIAWMNRGKGWAAATLLIAGMLGGSVASLFSLLFKH